MHATSGRPSSLKSAIAHEAAPIPPSSSIDFFPRALFVTVQKHAAAFPAKTGDDLIVAVPIEVRRENRVTVDQRIVEFTLRSQSLPRSVYTATWLPCHGSMAVTNLSFPILPTAMSLDPDFGQGDGSPFANFFSRPTFLRESVCRCRSPEKLAVRTGFASIAIPIEKINSVLYALIQLADRLPLPFTRPVEH